MSGNQRWTADQLDLMRACPAMDPVKLARLVSMVGPERTPDAVKLKRYEACGSRAERTEAVSRHRDPPLIDPERDAQFVRLLLTEGQRLNLYRSEAA